MHPAIHLSIWSDQRYYFVKVKLYVETVESGRAVATVGRMNYSITKSDEFIFPSFKLNLLCILKLSTKFSSLFKSLVPLVSGGSIVSVPHDLRTPFARYLAQNGSIVSMKRYCIDRVYRERRVLGFHPRELYECAFDIVTHTPGKFWSIVEKKWYEPFLAPPPYHTHQQSIAYERPSLFFI